MPEIVPNFKKNVIPEEKQEIKYQAPVYKNPTMKYLFYFGAGFFTGMMFLVLFLLAVKTIIT